MEPFHFESSECRLLGIYHPASDPGSRKGVVVCPPLLTDFSRSYVGLRQLAQGWSDAGYHVLRFDYSGTGDSFGNWNNVGPDNWVNDIAAAVEELKEIAGAEQITLAGVRFGGLLACEASKKVDSQALILWDPVIDSQRYTDNLTEHQSTLIELHRNLDASERALAAQELCGFEIPQWINSRSTQLVLPTQLPARIRQVHVISTQHQSNLSEYQQSWQMPERNVSFELVEFDCSWDKFADEVMNPAPVIRELIKCA